jgi:hypothetical protein
VIRLTISFKHGSGFPNPLIIGFPRLQLPNNKKYMVNMCVNMKIKNTSSTAQGGGGSFKNRKPTENSSLKLLGVTNSIWKGIM